MNKFYSVETVDFDDDAYAFCLSVDAKHLDYCTLCPNCGESIGFLFWLEPRKVELSRPKYGDFVCGTGFLVSERVKEAYEEYGLSGIKQFIPVKVSRVRHLRKNPPMPPKYFSLELVHSYARVDLEKSIIIGQRDGRYCSLCNPLSRTNDKIDGLYIDDSGWAGEDLFHLHELGRDVFASQRFVDICLEHQFANFNYVDTREYKAGYFS